MDGRMTETDDRKTALHSFVREFMLRERNLMNAALACVRTERGLQDEKFGPQQHAPIMWIAVLTEELGEAAQAALHLHWDGCTTDRKALYRQELVQIAAVAVAAIENLDAGILDQITRPTRSS